jgi:hypothetical protein
MQEPIPGIFIEAENRYNQPGRIVTFGPFFPQVQTGTAQERLREARAGYAVASAEDAGLREGVEWTRTINALNRGRRWALRRLFERLDPQLAPGIAVAVVPSHAAYVVDTPIRELACLLAASSERIDATDCLERHQTIPQIVFGGSSTRTLHRQTVHLLYPEKIIGQRVLLLDDIAKSGASLIACQDMLHEAGAILVQAVALARVSGVY